MSRMAHPQTSAPEPLSPRSIQAKRLKQLQKHGTVSGASPYAESKSEEGGSHRPKLERRVSIHNDGQALPMAKLSVDHYYNVMHLLGQSASSSSLFIFHIFLRL